MPNKDTEKVAYLQKEPSGVYYFVRPVPKALWPIYGKTKLIRKSLKTKDLREAKRLVIEMTYATEQDFNKHLAQANEVKARSVANEIVLNPETIRTISGQYKRHMLVKDDASRREWARISHTIEELPEANYLSKTYQYIERLKKYETYLARYNTYEFNTEYDDFINHQKLNIVSPSSRMIEDLKLAMLASAVEALTELVNRGGGQMKPTDEIAPKVLLGSNYNASKEDIVQLIKLWRDEQGSSLNLKTEASYLKTATEFNSFIKGKPATETKRIDVINWVNHLDQTKRLSIKTVGNKIKHLHAIYKVAIRHDKIEANPASEIEAKGRKSKGRRPFTKEEVPMVFNTILAEKNSGKVESYKWIALLAYTTGARIEEMAQLTFSDIFEERYTAGDKELSRWSILINEDEEGQHIKNASSKRRVPLHLDLINAGFVDFYNQRKEKAKDIQFLFPDLKATKYGVRSDSFSKWVNRRIDRVNDDQTIACHSFRHLYRELVSEVVPAIEEEVKDRLLGHSSTSVGRKYGGKFYPLPSLVDAVDRVVLPFRIPKIS